MQFIKIKPITVILIVAIAAVFSCVIAATPSDAGDHARELSETEAGRVLKYIYEGKTRAATGYVDSLESVCGDEPYYLLVKSRLARELLPVDDENKDRVEAGCRQIHADLDRVIDICSRRLKDTDDEGENGSSRLLLYRGVAWMYKSHAYSFARHFWRAGRAAKHGKNDLEKYLETCPGDPLALGTLGMFLYFADTIPTAIQYLSRLFLLPGGDREKGLVCIETAAATSGIYQNDFRVVLYTIYMLMEGRYEDGIAGTGAFLEQFPRYSRLAILPALLQPFYPAGPGRNVRLVDPVPGHGDNRRSPPGEMAGETSGRESPPFEAERYATVLVNFLNVYAGRFYAPYDVVEAELNRLAEPDTMRPDWIGGYAAFELGRLLASRGRPEEARTVFEWVRQNENVRFLGEDVEKLVEALDKNTGTGEKNSVPPDKNPQTVFVLGEELLIAGSFDDALDSYQRILGMDVDPWNEEFQMLAACRAAEIYGHRGDFDTAAAYLDRAASYYHGEFLVDLLLEARRRYYERLDDGKQLPLPGLPGFPSPSPASPE